MERIIRMGSSRIATRSWEPWSKRGNLGARAAFVLVVKEHHCGVIVIIAFWREISSEIFGRGVDVKSKNSRVKCVVVVDLLFFLAAIRGKYASRKDFAILLRDIESDR